VQAPAIQTALLDTLVRVGHVSGSQRALRVIQAIIDVTMTGYRRNTNIPIVTPTGCFMSTVLMDALARHAHILHGVRQAIWTSMRATEGGGRGSINIPIAGPNGGIGNIAATIAPEIIVQREKHVK